MEPIYTNPRQVPNLLSGEDAAGVIARASSSGFYAAGLWYPDSYRNNRRLVIDDGELAERIFDKLRADLPREIVDDEGAVWFLRGLNSRFRFCHYKEGQSFCIHRDGAHHASVNERSFLTAMIYLNDASEFEGGATRFYADRSGAELLCSITPRAGAALVFGHELWHDGAAVSAGEKFIMRSDVMYVRAEAREEEGHHGYIWSLSSLGEGEFLSAGRDRTVRRWRGGQCLQTMRGHGLSATAVCAFDRDHFVSGSRDGWLIFWERGAGTDFAEHMRVEAHRGAITAIARCGNRYAVASADGSLSLWSRDSALLERRAHGSWLWSLCSHEGRLCWVSESGTLGLGEMELKFDLPLRSVASVRDELWVGDALGRLWRVSSAGELLSSWPAHEGAITALCHFGDASYSAGEDGRVCQWRGEELIESWQFDDFVRSLLPHPGGVRCAGYEGKIEILAGGEGVDYRAHAELA